MFKSQRFTALLMVFIWLCTTAFQPFALAAAPAPADFNKSSPANGVTSVAPSGVTLSWGASTAGVTYEYCLFKNGKCPPPKWTNVGINQIVLLNLTPNTTYTWQVRAKSGPNTYTYANNNTPWSFRTGTNSVVPGDFSKVLPAVGSPNLPISAQTLTWTASVRAGYYEYCVDIIDNNFCDKTWVNVGLSTSAGLPTLVYNTTYYWQVRAINTAGRNEADAGIWFSFKTIIAPPAYFEKLSPSNASGSEPLNLTLEWSTSPSADPATYSYCVDDTNNNTCDTGWVDNLTSTTVQPSNLVYSKTYYWQVRAANATPPATEANSGAWWSFTTLDQMPSSFTKINPTNGTIDLGLNPWLYWSPSSGAASYGYCLITTNTVCTNGQYTPLPVTYVHLSGLQNNTTYYWEVRAVNGGNTVNPSEGRWHFTTLKAPPTYAPPPSFPTDEDTPLVDHLAATSGYNPLIYNMITPPANGSLQLSADGTFTYTPDANYNGSDTFTFVVSDGYNAPAGPFTAAITINSVDDAPVMDFIPNQSVMTGQPLTFTAYAADADTPYSDDYVTYSTVETLPAGAAIDPDTGVFTWTPVWSAAHPAPYTFHVRATDTTARYAEQAVNITVMPNIVILPFIRK